MLVAWCGYAQETPGTFLSASAEFNDAINWTSALRDPMRRMTNRAVTAYGIASLGAITCPVDKGLGADLFREAVVDLNNVPDAIFRDSKKVLPVATFSGLWKAVMGPGKKCDSRLSAPNDHAQARRDSERSEASSYLEQAKVTDDPERAAQLAQAAMEAGDPYELDMSSITSFLIEFRVRAPDLADDLFQRAVAFTLEAEIPNVDALAELGNYLFIAPTFAQKSEPVHNRTTYTVNNSTFSNWQGDHDGMNPDLAIAYIGAVTDLFSSNAAAFNVDPVAAYALVYQLLPRARDLGLADADTLAKISSEMQAQNSSAAAGVEGNLGAEPPALPSQSNFHRSMAQILAALTAGRFADAREILNSVDGVTMRSLTASFIDFSEAARAVRGKDSDNAMALAGKVPGGVKRALLYAGIVGSADNRVTAIFALHLALKDADLLSYEQRMAMLSALATAASGVDRDETQAVLSLLIASLNDANTNPRKLKFDPKYSFGFDGPRVLLESQGFLEAIQGTQGRQSFKLNVPGIGAYSLADFIAQAKGVDFMRLEASVGTLHSELQLTKGYLALATLRLKVAKAAVVQAAKE